MIDKFSKYPDLTHTPILYKPYWAIDILSDIMYHLPAVCVLIDTALSALAALPLTVACTVIL